MMWPTQEENTMNVTVHAPLPNAIFLVLGSQEAKLPDVTGEGLVGRAKTL
jgi:hypothetical protein